MESLFLPPVASTLVWMDVQATGEPSIIGHDHVNITEICCLAVDRNHFEWFHPESVALRCRNLLTLCVKPRFPILPECQALSGLEDEHLASQKGFDTSVADLLDAFFLRLKQPICLLSHYGYAFDFPLLKAELNRLQRALDTHLLCIDTRDCFGHFLSETQPHRSWTSNCSLSTLYQHFFEEETAATAAAAAVSPLSEARSAEENCILLSRLCWKKKEVILNWIDRYALPFSYVRPMGGGIGTL